MTKALLLHSGDGWIANLERVLSHHYSLVIRDYRTSRIDQLTKYLLAVELVIFDVSHDSPEMWAALQTLRKVKAAKEGVTAIVCVSRVNRGPRFQYEIERIGARFAYGH